MSEDKNEKTKVLTVIMSLAMAILVLTGCASWIDRGPIHYSSWFYGLQPLVEAAAMGSLKRTSEYR